VLAVGLAGCDRNPVDPLPSGAVEVNPPPVYSTWWNQMQQCSGRSGDFSSVRWFLVPSVGSLQGHPAAYYLGTNSIVLAEDYKEVAEVVRHEELHAILQDASHPSEFFVDKCGSLITL
jgi:hypothetical protein